MYHNLCETKCNYKSNKNMTYIEYIILFLKALKKKKYHKYSKFTNCRHVHIQYVVPQIIHYFPGEADHPVGTVALQRMNL